MYVPRPLVTNMSEDKVEELQDWVTQIRLRPKQKLEERNAAALPAGEGAAVAAAAKRQQRKGAYKQQNAAAKEAPSAAARLSLAGARQVAPEKKEEKGKQTATGSRAVQAAAAAAAGADLSRAASCRWERAAERASSRCRHCCACAGPRLRSISCSAS